MKGGYSGAALLLAATALAAGAQDVTFERLRHPEREPGSWLMYSGNYSGHRYSPLAELGPDNVARLAVRWVYQMRSPGLVETTPLVADGVMYLTEPPSHVTALDVRTGRTLWRYVHPVPEKTLAIGFPPVNRGVALLGDRVFLGTLEGHLVALDRQSGAVRWQTKVADNSLGYAITVAPLALDGKVIIGVSGGEAGIRGFLDAYDAGTGALLWRFHTVPGPGEPGNETWGGDSWKTGGAPTWVTGTYDPELDLLYWGTGNPAPDWNGDARPGDNLYSCSVLALDPDDGTLRWHFQFTPHDTHDWDANQIPVLIDGEVDGQPRKLLAAANRNAFYYLLDRQSGRFLRAEPYARQTWAKEIDENGRPVLIPGMDPSVEGTLVYPSLQGATNWFSPSYSPETGLFYVPTREMGAIYYKGEAEYEPGKEFMGGGEQALVDEAWGAIRALDARTGERRFEFRLQSPPWAGVLSTAGGLVFGGTDEGNIFAIDGRSGAPLWQFQAGGAVRTNPISFAIEGRQHVAISAGGALFVFGLPPSG